MKKVFTINTEEKEHILIKNRREYDIFARNINEAVSKINKIIPNKWHIVKAELCCEVEEDKDLKRWIEE